MTRKVYRTAQGKTVDLGALQLKNENVRAVGNMNVNARGDILDANNRPIARRNDQVSRQYQRQISNVTDDTVLSQAPVRPAKTEKKSTRAAKPVQEKVLAPPPPPPPPPEDFDDDFDKASVVQAAKTEPTPTKPSVTQSRPDPVPEPAAGGLAAAIARAREVRQERLPDPDADRRPGVRKI